MRTIIREIRRQPDHIRELATVLCTVVVVAVVSLVWFHSFQRNIYALLNPPQEAEDRLFVQESTSLLGSMFEALGHGKAQILELLSGSQATIMNPAQSAAPSDERTYPLPVSGNR